MERYPLLLSDGIYTEKWVVNYGWFIFYIYLLFYWTRFYLFIFSIHFIPFRAAVHTVFLSVQRLNHLLLTIKWPVEITQGIYISFFWQLYYHLNKSEINWCAAGTGIDALNDVYSSVPIWSSRSNHSQGANNNISPMMYYTNLAESQDPDEKRQVLKAEVSKRWEDQPVHIWFLCFRLSWENKALITGWWLHPAHSCLPGRAPPLQYSLCIIHAHLMVYLACLILMYKHFHVLQLIFQDVSTGSGVSTRP